MVDYTEHLRTWRSLNTFLRDCTEEQAQEALRLEKKSGRRPYFLLRIYARYNALREQRERAELVNLGEE